MSFIFGIIEMIGIGDIENEKINRLFLSCGGKQR